MNVNTLIAILSKYHWHSSTNEWEGLKLWHVDSVYCSVSFVRQWFESNHASQYNAMLPGSGKEIRGVSCPQDRLIILYSLLQTTTSQSLPSTYKENWQIELRLDKGEELRVIQTKVADCIYCQSQGNIKSKDEENFRVILLTFHSDDNVIFHKRETFAMRLGGGKQNLICSFSTERNLMM